MTWPEQFSPQAIRDVEDAVDWLAENGALAVARCMAIAVLSATRRITQLPDIGRVRPDLLPEQYRFWTVGGFPYLLVYNSERRPPPVLRVLHTARDLPFILKGLRDPGEA